MIVTILFYAVAFTPLGLAAWLFFVVQPRDTRRFVETIRQQQREITALEAEVAPPWGCIRHHGHGVEPCAPGCWLAQEDTARGDSEVDGGLVESRVRYAQLCPGNGSGWGCDESLPCPVHGGERDTLVSEGQVAS